MSLRKCEMMWEPSGAAIRVGVALACAWVLVWAVDVRKVLAILRPWCVVEVSLGSVWVGFGHRGHREGSGELYQNGGLPPEGPIVVPFEVFSKAGRSDKVPGRFCRVVRMG